MREPLNFRALPAATVFAALFAVLVMICSVSYADEAESSNASRELAARLLLAEGEKLNEATQLDQALIIFSRVRSEFPGTEAASYSEFWTAQVLMRLGRQDEAIALSRSIIEKNPKSVLACWAQYCIGAAFAGKGDLPRAAREFDRVGSMPPSRADTGPLTLSRAVLGERCAAYLRSRTDVLDAAEYLGIDRNNTKQRAEVYAMLAAHVGRTEGPDRAQPILDRLAAECLNEKAELWWARVQVAISGIDIPTCTGECERTLVNWLKEYLRFVPDADDDGAMAAIALAKYYRRNGRRSDAMSVLQSAAMKHTDTSHGPQVVYEYGEILHKQGQKEEALAVLRGLIRDKPLSPYAISAQSLIDQSLPVQASASLQELVKAAIDNWDPAWQKLALAPRDASLIDPILIARQSVALAKEDRPEVAVELIDKFAMRTGMLPGKAARAGLEVIFAAIRYAADRGAVSHEALSAFQLLRKSANESEASLYLSRIVDAVRGNLSRVIDQEERATAAMWVQAELLRRGKYQEAADVLRDIVELAGMSEYQAAEVRYRLGLCYWELGNLALARRYMQRVVDEYPRSYWSRRARGTLYLWHDGADAK